MTEVDLQLSWENRTPGTVGSLLAGIYSNSGYSKRIDPGRIFSFARGVLVVVGDKLISSSRKSWLEEEVEISSRALVKVPCQLTSRENETGVHWVVTV